MALFTKINTPCSTVGGVPNANNKTDELLKINALAKKTNRSNTGQVSYTSETSGTIYRTADYPNIANIYNKGETGLYNLLIRLYGGDNGFIITPDDYNNIEKELSSVSSSVQSNIDTTYDTINNYPSVVAQQIQSLKNTQNNNAQTLAKLITYIDKDVLILRATPSSSSVRFDWGSQYPNYYSKDAEILDFRFFMQSSTQINLNRYGKDGILFAPAFKVGEDSYTYEVGAYRPKIQVSKLSKTYIDVTFQTIQDGRLENSIQPIGSDNFYLVGYVYMVLQFQKQA